MISGPLAVTDDSTVGIITCSATSEERNTLSVTLHMKLVLVEACYVLSFRILALRVKDKDSI